MLLAVIHALVTLVTLPWQDPAGPAQGTAAITGVVVDATTGAAIAGAVVRIEERRTPGSGRGRAYQQVSTPKGRFAFIDLPAADEYTITSTKPGYLAGGHERPDPRLSAAPVSLRDGQWRRDLRVTMARPGSISGTVVDERGEPVVETAVRVLPQIMIAGRVQWTAGIAARTDDRGVYRIGGLGPGTYLVSVPSVQATLPASAAIRAPGAFSGTSRADLNAMSDAAHAEKLLVDAGNSQQLVVGRFHAPPPPAPDGQRMAYPMLFYPNATRPADGSVVELRLSEDRTGIDFQLQPVRTARVSGTLQGPPEAIGNQFLRLLPAGLEELGQGSEAATTVTSPDGRFTFLDVPHGRYVLDLRHTLLELTYTSIENPSTALIVPVPFPTRGAGSADVKAAPAGVQLASLRDWADESYWGQLIVDVSGRTLENIVLVLRKPMTLSGRMVWAAGSKAPAFPPRPHLEPADGRRSLGYPSVPGPMNGPSFAIEGLMAGGYFLRVSGANVESIAWNGQDYTDRPFDGAAGRDITDVVVTLTSASSSIAGTVRDGNATLTSAAAVIAFPTDRDMWSNYGLNPPRLASVLTTTDGRYRLDALPAGEYYLVAVPASYERAWIDPSFLAAHAGSASRVRLDRPDSTVSDFALSLVR